MSTGKDYILLVEDEPVVQSNNMKILTRHGYNIKQANCLTEAKAIIKEEMPCAIILDLQLPDGNGLAFLRELRNTSDVPVLILTAMGTPDDIIRGFDVGSDDYLTKPYDLKVFLIRIEALLRRASTVPDVLIFDRLRLYPSSGKAVVGDEEIQLSQKEYSILQLLIQHPERLLSAEYIYEKVWGQKMLDDDNSLKVAVSKLRTKLTDAKYTITASRGEGYYIEKID